MSQIWKPRPYQIRSMKMMVSQGAAGMLLDPGLGKTSITLAAFRALRKSGHINRMLVVAPLRVCHSVWPQEVAKWSQFSDIKIEVLHGSKKIEALESEADVLVINPEGLPWLIDHEDHLSEWPEMLVIDESTKFKHTRTKRFKIMKKMLNRFRRRYILTGTPAPNGLMDLFGQIYLLDYGSSLGRYITHFRNEFFTPAGYGGYKWVLQPGAEERIYERVSPLTLRLEAKDHIKMPKKIEHEIAVDLPKKARSQYDIFKKTLMIQLRDGEVTAMNAGVLTGKLRQIANGGVYLDSEYGKHHRGRGGPNRFSVVHDEKVNALEDLIEQLQGQPLLVAYEFRHDKARIIAKLGELPALDGSASAKKGKLLEEEWNQGKYEVLLVHPQSAAHGLNLQSGGNHLVWFGLPWDLENYDQLIRRIWRPGQKNTCFIYHIIASRTIDSLVLKTLARKKRTQKDLLDALKGKKK